MLELIGERDRGGGMKSVDHRQGSARKSECQWRIKEEEESKNRNEGRRAEAATDAVQCDLSSRQLQGTRNATLFLYNNYLLIS